ncbi:hypothetical protein ACFL6S_25305 [Candidatus Poribacteria bacterium]
MKRNIYLYACIIGCLVCLALGASADQFIYVKVADFDPELSAFDEAVAGNTWTETEQEGALFGTVYGGPGDNNMDAAGPHLVIKLPEPVKAGESTDDGKTWIAWARMFHPEALVTGNNSNSIFLRMSPDANSWTPQSRGTTQLLWNDPAGAQNTLLFPNSINGVDSILTDVGEDLPWFWQNHKGTIDARAPDSAIDPPLAVGDNYVELIPRESNPVNYPRIEIICFRNDGKQPSDAEALQYIQGIQPVQPAGKLVGSWGSIKSEY